MEYKIKHLTEEELKEIKTDKPGSIPLEYALIDKDFTIEGDEIIIGYFETQEEAQACADEIVQEEGIIDDFEDFITNMVNKTGLSKEEITEIIQNSF